MEENTARQRRRRQKTERREENEGKSRDAIKSSKEELAEEKQLYKDLVEVTHEQGKQVNMLLRKHKKLFGAYKSLKPLDEPVVLLIRTWGEIEVHEGVKGDTFVIPPPPEHKQKVKVGEYKTKAPGKKVAYLHGTDLKQLAYGRDTIKCYLIDEQDAVPIKSDVKVWSERLEYTIDAILLNFEKYKKGMEADKNKWLVDLVKYGGLIFLGYLIIKFLFLNDTPEPSQAISTAAAAKESLKNMTGITVIR